MAAPVGAVIKGDSARLEPITHGFKQVQSKEALALAY
jgi:hypothetical protein